MYSNILQYVSRYITLSEEEEAFFISVLKHKKLRKKQYLLQAGDVCRHECFVLSGCLRSYYVDEQGQEHVVQFSVENWWTSDLASFISGKPATYNIDALEDSEVLQIEKNDLEQLYVQVPKFDRMFRVLLQNAFVAQQERTAQSLSLSAQEQYLNFIKKYPDVEQRVPNHQIASYLGITPESLSRIRKQYSGS